MTIIPLKDDGSPDWEVITGEGGVDFIRKDGGMTGMPTVTFGRMGYLAALERCAKLAESETSKVPIIAPGTNAAWDEAARTIAATIRQWIEKEKANG